MFLPCFLFSGIFIVYTHTHTYRLSSEYGDDLNESICYESALDDFDIQYPMSSGIFSKSKTMIKPFELFGLLFSFADYRAMHAALLNKSDIIYADDGMSQCIAAFEKSVNKMYDPSACLNADNMFEKDVNVADLERELAMGGSPREIQKRMMKKMMEGMMKNKAKESAKKREQSEKKEKLYLNQQLEIEIGGGGPEGRDKEKKEIDWQSVYTRENGRILVEELKDAMKICVDALIDQRNKNLCEVMMKCDGQNIVAFVNFANMDGIEETFMHLS